jgi:MoaA/NifB/PqqE/SkfB family radical SAM enzyme
VYLKLALRLLRHTDPRAWWHLAWTMGLRGAVSVERFKWRLRQGEVFPPFLYVSVINSCNLRCQGCWVDVAAKQQTISPEAFARLVREAKAMGNVFFGVVGGEPFMHPRLFELLEPHRDCYFQVFTNGQFITREKARRLRELGNVTPLISVEGDAVVSDERRGRSGVLSKTMQGLENCLAEKVFTGVCTSVCKTNLDVLVNEKWIDRLIDMGVMYTWFHVYRPMGPNASADLCLSAAEQRRLREFVVEMRTCKPIIIVDAYYNGEGEALCPAATGLTHHINPWGGIEPCPIIQFATESIHPDGDPRPLRQKFRQSSFLAAFRELAAGTTRGCIALERPDLLKGLVEKAGARDATARQTALAELAAMRPRTSQYHPGEEVPEKSWGYRLAKRLWFSDFGVYRGRAAGHATASAPAVLGAGRE